ncbi:BTB/POZ domain-containing protein At5g47800 isoform X2 [Impatiens glandulifera]|uniref:BTB/POZ domain-containing protein At5g47800 isoform X2 n=1 Tax=Impatiens glandulifera TaxID=253017 RepID=UPI001FB19F95|nr:BTB/POZ domain-containing protein At5g47800 isoform X2 [Impatiens glandulifera]
MKYMKLGNRPDTFYTDEATRTLISDIPTDLVISIHNTTYLLHKHALLPKCELLLTNSNDVISMELHDIPGGEDSFELCAKFCYGIAIQLSARNVVSAFCAAKFLQMTDDQNNSSNLVQKLDLFFKSCILEGWKDSIVALQTTTDLPKWSERFGVVRSCMDSILDKILTPPSKVTWSFTYTRPGYEQKNHRSVPKDWWTEDLSDIDIDLFRCIITAIVKSTATTPFSSQLIGEALHVYLCRWLPLPINQNQTNHVAAESSNGQSEQRKIVEVISGLIPSEKGAVSFRFLMRLLSNVNSLRVSSATKAELIRKAGSQLESAAVDDLLLANHDIDTVRRVVESFLTQNWRKNNRSSVNHNMLIMKIGNLIDSYLQVIARDSRTTVSKFLSLASSLPDIARQDHDHLYKAINNYLKEHPEVKKEEKKRICRILDCTKLSPQVCSHAVRNERLPLRTVVQLLFFSGLDNINITSSTKTTNIPSQQEEEEEMVELDSITHDGCDQSKRKGIRNKEGLDHTSEMMSRNGTPRIQRR